MAPLFMALLVLRRLCGGHVQGDWTVRHQVAELQHLQGDLSQALRLEGLRLLKYAKPTWDGVDEEAGESDPDVAPVLRRITTRRVDYLVQAMAAAGYPAAEAYERAVLAYTTWLGLVQTERAVGGRLFSSNSARTRYLAFLKDVVWPRAT